MIAYLRPGNTQICTDAVYFALQIVHAAMNGIIQHDTRNDDAENYTNELNSITYVPSPCFTMYILNYRL